MALRFFAWGSGRISRGFVRLALRYVFVLPILLIGNKGIGAGCVFRSLFSFFRRKGEET